MPEWPGSVTMVDVGCGFGGLTMALARAFPEHGVLGMEIRIKVVRMCQTRIFALRELAKRQQQGDEASQESRATVGYSDLASVSVDELRRTALVSDKDVAGGHHYKNAFVVRCNVMRHITHFFAKGTLEKIFFAFPDPHFKKKNSRRRIISPGLLDEYTYVLKKGGRLYTVTDVHDLHVWMRGHCAKHPLLRHVENYDDDISVHMMCTSTEEGAHVDKVAKFGRDKLVAVFERI